MLGCSSALRRKIISVALSVLCPASGPGTLILRTMRNGVIRGGLAGAIKGASEGAAAGRVLDGVGAGPGAALGAATGLTTGILTATGGIKACENF